MDSRKQERLRRAGASYLARYELDAPARFDVAEVYVQENGKLGKDVSLGPGWHSGSNCTVSAFISG